MQQFQQGAEHGSRGLGKDSLQLSPCPATPRPEEGNTPAFAGVRVEESAEIQAMT